MENIADFDSSYYKAHQVLAKPGDTVISITESLNEPANMPNQIDHLLQDFSKLNPYVNPYQLKTQRTYLFPMYIKKEKLD